MLYIRQVRVQAPGTTNQHIIDVKYSGTKTGPLMTASRATIVSVIDGGGDIYTYNNGTGAGATVVTHDGANYLKYITTEVDGKETNNLLELPRFQ